MADVNMEALPVPEDWHFQWPGPEQQTEEDEYEGPETHYFIRHAGCDLCQLSFDPSQIIIASMFSIPFCLRPISVYSADAN